jgi:Spy/CpxP family protein refolding chaperone
MKLSLAFSLLFACSLVAAEPPHRDALAEYLFSPDLIMHNAEAIDLTDAQRDKLEGEMQKAHERFEELHAKREKQLEATVALLKRERVDEAAALAQLEKLLDQEREIRRAHFSLMITLKNKLTPHQQTKLEELKREFRPPDRAERPEPRPGKPPPIGLQEKMKRLKAGVKQLEDEGGDATSIGEIMRDFKPLMDEQKYKQAEEVVDEGLKALREQKR